VAGSKESLLVVLFAFTSAAVGAGTPGSQEPQADLRADEQAIQKHIKALGDIDSDARKAAAEELRKIVAKYPSGTIYLATKDGGEAAWREKVKQVKPGMSKADVLKLLPKFAEASEGGEIADGDSHTVIYRLDYHWTVRISYRNTNKVIDKPELFRHAYRVHVAPPAGFTGTWTTWHVNGQKGYETQYAGGKYHGTLTSYHDNGAKSYEQHYVNDVSHGTCTGWEPNGQMCYLGRYQNGKQDGKWTHWHANGKLHSETNYANGKYNGWVTYWHDNGQIGSLNHYVDGVKHGREASWDEKGNLHYDRVFENGKIVEKP
jgi:hypothetical protein